MTRFLGENEVAVDAKGRFLLPASFRKQIADGLGEKFVVKCGLEKCITIYTTDSWAESYDKISKLNDMKKENRDFKRAFLFGASYVDIDSADRLLIPKTLLEYAGIEKEAVLIGSGKKMELWSKDTYYAMQLKNVARLEDMAESAEIDLGEL
ncbi:division/cell wall cluster transcriptional repressor MraZ [Nemorincola caseinilytica]|uniref:Transcriptional regulator MraZ n=1 Tax=Nemorincola caseinilytica TaxID=2054315 RepID=A0ABP8NJ47_9BACT